MRNRELMRLWGQIELFISEVNYFQSLAANTPKPNQRTAVYKIIADKLGAVSAYADLCSKEMQKKAERKGGAK